MSSKKETPEAIEAAKRLEESLELINRARNESAAVSIETPRERAIAEFKAEAALEQEPNPLEINANLARLRMAARKPKIEPVQ